MLSIRVFAALCAAAPLVAQESVRDLDRPGEHHKHLTLDTVDRWLFGGRADEVVRVDVSSSEFDPVIELVELDEGRGIRAVLVAPVDDPGSRSHMLARLGADGRYAILVHGPGNRGGGNYRLYVERMTSVPLPDGGEAQGFVGESGMAHVRFVAAAGETVVPRGLGVVEVLDPKGRSVESWAGCYDVELDGEHYVRVRAQPGSGFRVAVDRARRRALDEGAALDESLAASGLDEWTFPGQVGAFRTLEVSGDRTAVRVTPVGKVEDAGLDGRPVIRWLPAHSKGDAHRFAFVLGHDGPFRVQVRSLAPTDTRYGLRFADTSRPLAADAAVAAALPVGGSQFFAFDAAPGQVLRIDVDSAAFDPVVRLTSASGAPSGENDDGGQGLACRHGWLVTQGGRVRVQVASFGDGGGGAYRIRLTDVPVPVLAPGAAATGSIGQGAADHWHLEGRAGTLLFLSARSTTADMALALFDPTGQEVGADRDSGADRDALLAIRLPRDGRYTVAVSSTAGAGDYVLQALEPDAAR